MLEQIELRRADLRAGNSASTAFRKSGREQMEHPQAAGWKRGQ
jgi:hypothetical protein